MSKLLTVTQEVVDESYVNNACNCVLANLLIKEFPKLYVKVFPDGNFGSFEIFAKSYAYGTNRKHFSGGNIGNVKMTQEQRNLAKDFDAYENVVGRQVLITDEQEKYFLEILEKTQ